MTDSTVNGSGNGARCGAQTLRLLSSHRNCLILRALADGPKRQAELRRATGLPAQTTLRAHLRGLEEVGAIVKHRRNAFPGAIDYELEKPGEELLFVVALLERWLAAAPGQPLELGSDAAKAAIRALAEAWSATMLRALASGPLSLTELDRIIAGLSYPALERRLAALRLANLVTDRPANGRGTPYAVTDWLRHGVAPLIAAIRWECRNGPNRPTPIGPLDAEAAFLLIIPLLRLGEDASGECRMAVELPSGGARQLAGVVVELADGAVQSCTSRLHGNPDAWISGSVAAWLAAMIETDSDSLELGGDSRLAQALLGGLHALLFGGSAALKTSDVSKTDRAMS